MGRRFYWTFRPNHRAKVQTQRKTKQGVQAVVDRVHASNEAVGLPVDRNKDGSALSRTGRRRLGRCAKAWIYVEIPDAGLGLSSRPYWWRWRGLFA